MRVCLCENEVLFFYFRDFYILVIVIFFFGFLIVSYDKGFFVLFYLGRGYEDRLVDERV